MKNQHLILFIMLGFAISFCSCDPKPIPKAEEELVGPLEKTLKIGVNVFNYAGAPLNASIVDLKATAQSLKKDKPGEYTLTTNAAKPEILILSNGYESTTFTMTDSIDISLIAVNLSIFNDASKNFTKDISVNFINDIDVTFDFEQDKKASGGILTLPITSLDQVTVKDLNDDSAKWVQNENEDFGILTTTASNQKINITKNGYQPLGINLADKDYVSKIIAPLKASNGNSITVSFKVKSKKKTKVKVVMNDAHGPTILVSE